MLILAIVHYLQHCSVHRKQRGTDRTFQYSQEPNSLCFVVVARVVELDNKTWTCLFIDSLPVLPRVMCIVT